MAGLPLSILAFAAGVYLLIKVKKEYLSSLFSVLAWFVIVASLVSIGCSSVKCYYNCCRTMCHGEECRMEKQIIIKDGEEGGCHHTSMGECNMPGCKMEGDSVVMEKEMCEKMIGKDACDKMCKERGRCIMGKEECMAMCHAGGKPCCAEKEEGCSMHKEGAMAGEKPGCCMGGKAGEEKKECCKKKAQ